MLGRALEEVRTAETPYALLFIDLDGFKEVNDTAGHLAGDQMLVDIARALRRVVRQDDVLARLGGDEFAVLTRNCTLNAAEAIADKLRATVRSVKKSWGKEVFRVGASIGIAALSSDLAAPKDVIALADGACYAAKRAGRDRVMVASTDGPRH